MLQLVGPDWVGDAAGELDGASDPDPLELTDGDMRGIALQLLHQVPKRPEEAAAVLEHLRFLVEWRAGRIQAMREAEARAAERPAGGGPPLLMLLSCVTEEVQLQAAGFRDAANGYAALVLRRGFLGAGFAKA